VTPDHPVFVNRLDGHITPANSLADLVVCGKDLFEIDPHEILNSDVEMTMVGGRIGSERA
jgi:predicted amidohydrolase YtcJ